VSGLHIKSFSEFNKEYENRGFIDKISSRYYPLKRLNPKQVKRYYLQYVRKWEKAHGAGVPGTAVGQSEDSKLSAFVRERDGGCRVLKILSEEELEEWRTNHNALGNILDAAHIFGKGAYPWMRFDDKNVVTLNRFSHNCLDNGKSPINGKSITDSERAGWWRRIAGKDWEYLKIRARERN